MVRKRGVRRSATPSKRMLEGSGTAGVKEPPVTEPDKAVVPPGFSETLFRLKANVPVPAPLEKVKV